MAGKGTILVVDDEPPSDEVLADFFTPKGYEVLCAQGGLEGLSKLEKHRPDVILLDVRMPDMDGITVLRRIREANPWVGVLMMSGNTDTEAAKETLQLGAFDYVLKPFDFDYLDRAVHKMLTAASPADDHAGPRVGGGGARALPARPPLRPGHRGLQGHARHGERRPGARWRPRSRRRPSPPSRREWPGRSRR